MAKKKRGRAAKGARRAQQMAAVAEAEAAKGVVRSMVFSRGSVGKQVRRLVKDIRKVMEPQTASNLKVRKTNTLQDLVGVAKEMGVTHFLVLTRSDENLNLRMIRVPHGPTVYFRVESYSHACDVISAQKRPVSSQDQYLKAPLAVLNGFQSGESERDNSLILTQSMFQNLFPKLNVATMDLNDMKRCVLVQRDQESNLIEFRHYRIKTTPAGVTKSSKKLMKKKIPDLSKYKDISDYFENPGQLSESEYEVDVGPQEVELNQELKSRGIKGEHAKASVRLSELGPRLTLRLLKIESGLDEGEVLFHSYHHKTPEEAAATARKVKKKARLRAQRRKQQDLNVQKKKEAKEKHKERCNPGLRKEEPSGETDEKPKRKFKTSLKMPVSKKKRLSAPGPAGD